VLKNSLTAHCFVVSRLKMLIYWHINSAFSPENASPCTRQKLFQHAAIPPITTCSIARAGLLVLSLSLVFFGTTGQAGTQSETNGRYQNDDVTEAAIATRPAARPTKTLVIIIDDIGNDLKPGHDVIDLPGKVNVAVLPFTPHARELANSAHLAGKEVLLHAPMSSISKSLQSKGTLTPDLSEAAFRTSLADALAQVPHARGINNHQGSDLTQRHVQMSWVMQELDQRALYFVDSRTSTQTVAAATAAEFGIPNLSRRIFLDNERNKSAIAARFVELLRIVLSEGQAVAIGHPYPETIEYLRWALPQLDRLGIRLAYVSEVLNRQTASSADSEVDDQLTHPIVAPVLSSSAGS
jgi:uncharacterized protein